MRSIAHIGIDPGKTGAVALVYSNGFEVSDWPGDAILACAILETWLSEFNIVQACLEKVSAMPKQGVVSTFNFGQNFGIWQGILSALKVPHLMPTPKQWQRGLVDNKAGPNAKTRSLVTARRLFPGAPLQGNNHHGRADALLMAFWVMNRKF